MPKLIATSILRSSRPSSRPFTRPFSYFIVGVKKSLDTTI